MDEKLSWTQRLFSRKRRAGRPPLASPTLSMPAMEPSSPPPIGTNLSIPNPAELASAAWSVGDVVFGLYDVVAILGEGGMGFVYLVRHRDSSTLLAVKRPKPELFRREVDKENFIREAETWLKLKEHPHILRCHGVLGQENIPCILFDYADGGSLAQSISSRRLYQGGEQQVLARILDIVIQFAWGLHAAHEQGLVHQDIKPANVLLTQQGFAKVSDFGLAKARAIVGETKRQTVKGQQSQLVSGGGMTPAYCSPEQAAHRNLTRKTDIWSWAVSVLEMFAGEVTWMMGPAAGVALEQLQNEDRWQVRPPEEVRKILTHCLQLEPEKRPATVAEVAEELEAVYAQLVGDTFVRKQLLSTETTLDPYLLGVSLGSLGKYEEALTALEQAIRLEPTAAPVYISQGRMLAALGRYKEALTALEQAIKLSPTDADVHRIKGDLLYQQGRQREALAAYERAILLNTRDAQAYTSKGDVLAELGRQQEALTAYEQAIKLGTKDASTYTNKGVMLAELGKYEEALAAYEQAIRLNPKGAKVYTFKGGVLGRLGRRQEALAALEQAIKLDPTAPLAHRNKAVLLSALGRQQEALAALEQAIKLAPTDPVTHKLKGRVLAAGLDRDEEALTAFERAIKLDPTDVDAHQLKNAVLAKLSR